MAEPWEGEGLRGLLIDSRPSTYLTAETQRRREDFSSLLPLREIAYAYLADFTMLLVIEIACVAFV